MATIFQTTFSNGFLRTKMHEFRLTSHWSLFLGVQLTICQHWFRWWLGAGQATSHYLNQCWLVYWRKYALLGLNELKAYGCNYFTYPCLNPRWSVYWRIYASLDFNDLIVSQNGPVLSVYYCVYASLRVDYLMPTLVICAEWLQSPETQNTNSLTPTCRVQGAGTPPRHHGLNQRNGVFI